VLSPAPLTRDDEQSTFLARLYVLLAIELPSRAIEVPLTNLLAQATWRPASTSLDRGPRKEPCSLLSSQRFRAVGSRLRLAMWPDQLADVFEPGVDGRVLSDVAHSGGMVVSESSVRSPTSSVMMAKSTSRIRRSGSVSFESVASACR
jgi:hypothetical protein